MGKEDRPDSKLGSRQRRKPMGEVYVLSAMTCATAEMQGLNYPSKVVSLRRVRRARAFPSTRVAGRQPKCSAIRATAKQPTRCNPRHELHPKRELRRLTR